MQYIYIYIYIYIILFLTLDVMMEQRAEMGKKVLSVWLQRLRQVCGLKGGPF